MNNNYNYPPQQNYQTYQAYSNYDNSYASQYPNYDYYYQQPNHQQQYYQPAIDPHSGRPSTYHIDQATSYAGHPPPLQETYDQNSLAQWNNYYAQYYPQQHYQRPPPVKPNKPLNPAADTRPMSKFCCNRVLKTVQAITQHESLHIKCPHCDFMCLKSYLEEHEEQYHGKPKSKKLSRPDGIAPPNAPKLDTPEKLATWIAERKKNWPTPANIERRTREEAEQMARGELPLKRKANIQHNQDKRQRIENNSVENKDDDDVMDPERDAVSSKDPSSMGLIQAKYK
ncbi:hypothetical protein G6F37_000393 [Rhizopus arrhizus]|nr:hypothetical protein G6F38_006696 [Rhizopus arrhizus]KAG1164335.1 hypothetical protein G6F37_000393 [Rhizopus arrhizus]